MISTFGTLPKSMPAGFFKAVHFPTLARVDQTTGDHRRLASEGGRTRDLPLGIATMPATAMGHDGAIPSGTLFQVTFDPENNNVSGDGFLLDDEMGRKTAYYIETGAQRGNSVDLAEVKARFVEDMENGEYWIEFYEWAIAKTTIVGTPAFAEGRAEITASMIDELMAGWMVDPMAPLSCTFDTITTHIIGSVPETEVVADGTLRQKHSMFFVPEAPKPQKVTVHDDLSITGHLALWESCHDGFDGQCITVPRPQDAYASFNQPGVPTEKGTIQTGPIFALGGHRTLIGRLTPEAEAAAYGGIENAWADVRVVEGEHGPWLSGAVRPGVDPKLVFAARSSRVSGHWKGNKLKAIVSVNSEGYTVPGDDREVVASFEFGFDAEGERELVAGFPGCVDATPDPVTNPVLTALNPADLTALADSIRAQVLADIARREAELSEERAAVEARRAALATQLNDDKD